MLTSSTISLILCVCMLYVFHSRRTYNGFAYWALASALYTIALLLMGLRNIIPDLASIIIGNVLVISGNGLISCGLELFTGTTRRATLHLSLTALATISFIYFTYHSPNINIRIIIISAIIAFQYGYCAYIIHRHIPSLIGSRNIFLEVSFTLQALWLLLRILQTFIFEDIAINFINTSIIHSITMIIFFCGNIFIAIGLIILNFQKVEFDLLTAMKEINVLRGIIPICSCCKKIRDDQGIWNRIEAYFQNHSDIEFTHGICPECRQKMYPELNEKDKEESCTHCAK